MISEKSLAIAAKIESVYGTDASPTLAANWIKCNSQPTINPLEIDEEEVDTVMPFWGNQDTLLGPKTGKLSLSVLLSGSGTAGVVPPWGVLVRGCGASENILAAAVTGAAQVGGGTNGIKLAAGASALDNAYNGFEITLTTGTGAGQKGLIYEYDGTTKIALVIPKQGSWTTDATTGYSIGAGVAYRPAYTSLEALTLYSYIGPRLHKFVGVRGEMGAEFMTNKGPAANFDFTGLYAPVTDAATPSIVMSAWKNPLKVGKANTPFVGIHGVNNIGLESLGFKMGNVMNFIDLANIQEEQSITDRKSKLDLSIEDVSIATLDSYGKIGSNAAGQIGLTHGTVAGNMISFIGGNTTLKKPGFGSRNGYRTQKLEALLNTQGGSDEWAILSH